MGFIVMDAVLKGLKSERDVTEAVIDVMDKFLQAFGFLVHLLRLQSVRECVHQTVETGAQGMLNVL